MRVLALLEELEAGGTIDQGQAGGASDTSAVQATVRVLHALFADSQHSLEEERRRVPMYTRARIFSKIVNVYFYKPAGPK